MAKLRLAYTRSRHGEWLFAAQTGKDLLRTPSREVNPAPTRGAATNGQVSKARSRMNTDTASRSIRAKNLGLLKGVPERPAIINRLKHGHRQIKGGALAEVRSA